MTTREKFKRRVIELIHGLPYDEAIKKEIGDGGYEKFYRDKYVTCNYCGDNFRNPYRLEDNTAKIGYDFGRCSDCNESRGGINISISLTIGRVLKALSKVYGPDFYDKVIFVVDIWKLTNEDGSECTDDSQSDETISKLYELIK